VKEAPTNRGREQGEKRVRLVALDVDGVLTDGSLYYTEAGETLKRFNVKDGHGVRLLIEAGVNVAVVSARSSGPLERRLSELGIEHVRLNCREKLAGLAEIIAELGVDLDQVCFVGDDLLDVPVLQAVGFGVAVADAHPRAKAVAKLVTRAAGGQGAVREVADYILSRRQALEAFGVIVPARYASTRLPGKPLRKLCGKPLVLHVLERAQRSAAAFVVVATDDERVAIAVRAAGGEAVMTSPEHASGTDRLAEVARQRGLSNDDIVVNVQGDEPLLDPALIDRVAAALSACPAAGIATLATPFSDSKGLSDPNQVKVAVNAADMALYFSRAPIPWVRDGFDTGRTRPPAPGNDLFLRHIGVYAYRAGVLARLAAETPVPVEQAEELEQLRALWLGIGVHVTRVAEPHSRGVDTEEDLRAVEAILGGNG